MTKRDDEKKEEKKEEKKADEQSKAFEEDAAAQVKEQDARVDAAQAKVDEDTAKLEAAKTAEASRPLQAGQLREGEEIVDGTQPYADVAQPSPPDPALAYFKSVEHMLVTLKEHARTTHGLAGDKGMMEKVHDYIAALMADSVDAEKAREAYLLVHGSKVADAIDDTALVV
jgi:hypothetical protein